MINNAYLNRIFADLQKNHPNEPEFLQAVDEVFESLQYVVDKHPEWEEAGLMERFVEPERIIIFRVPWVDDNGKVHLLFILILGNQEIMKLYKCFFSIIIICINNHKWLFYHILASQNCLPGSPRFHASFRKQIAFWQIFQLLIDILNRHHFR